ncbi:MAG TPA: hypothetical protein VG458_09415 [Solirubrobacterales bacterium]|nr:hypothetical protein [Solirubrobacterales bacterium]
MSQAKAGTKKASPSKKGEAARAEKQQKAQPTTFDFRGLELRLPKQLPLSFAFKYRRIMKDRDGSQFAFLDLLEGVIGTDQFEAVEQKLDEDGLTIDNDAEVLMDLIDGVMAELGTSPGE